MKPRNWRTYYWYRPPPLTMPPMTPAEIERQAEEYCRWLADERQFSLQDAAAYVEKTRRK